MSGNRYTIEQEMKIGRHGMADLEKKLPTLPAGHPMSKYVSTLGQQLAAKAPGYKFPYTFKVVREKSINAFALPGGPTHVHTGLITPASSDSSAASIGARQLDWFGTSAVREGGKISTERVRLVALQTESGVVLYLVLVAPDDDFQSLWPVFERILSSLQVAKRGASKLWLRIYARTAGAAARLGRISPIRRICAPTPRSFSSMFS